MLIKRATDYPIQRVLDRYIRTNGISESDARLHEIEMKRYLLLRAMNLDSRFPLASGPVDELWHTFLLFTKEYVTFCNEVAGAFIHHNPGPAAPTEEEVRSAKHDFEGFIAKYRSVFHEEPSPELWPRIGEPGVLWSC